MNEPPIYLSAEDLRAIHTATIEKFGGAAGICDENLLESAAAQPQQTFEGRDLYPTISLKAACYAYGIANDHPFVDGNKRTATAAMGAFLRLNGVGFKPRQPELLAEMLDVAQGEISIEELAAWIEEQ